MVPRVAAGPAEVALRDSVRLDGTHRHIQHRGVTALAPDPTIRRQVIAAAAELLAAEREASVARIARAAGVSRATLYRHFSSRDELLRIVELAPRPDARTRILVAARDLLAGTTLADLSMDDVARAAGVSRGTIYRIFPGKAALLRGLVDRYAPFAEIEAIVRDRGAEPPRVVFVLAAAAFAGAAREQLGLVRAVFLEATRGSSEAMTEAWPVFFSAIGALAGYAERQMAMGRLRPMPPILALQAIIGPVFFHLMTRPLIDRMGGLALPPGPEAVERLVEGILDGLEVREP